MTWPRVLLLLVAEAQAVVLLGSLSKLAHGETRMPVPEKPRAVELSLVGTNIVEPGVVEPSFAEASFVEASFMEPGVVEASFVEPGVVEPSYVEPSFVEARRSVTSRPTTTRRSTQRPTTALLATITMSPDTVSQWEFVQPGCYTYSTGHTKTIIPGTLVISAATLLLPRFGRTLAITLPRPALMVEAYVNNWAGISKVMSADGLTWRLVFGQCIRSLVTRVSQPL
jgi:hypothetical protein